MVDLPSAASSVRRGSLLLAAGYLLLPAAAAPGGAVPDGSFCCWPVRFLTAGEVCLAAGSWEVGFALADPSHPGRSQDLYSSGVPAARALGPTALVALC